MRTQDTLLPRLVDCVRDAEGCGHGSKADVYARYCRELGWVSTVDGAELPNLARLYRALAKAGLCKQRNQRRDAGQHSLTEFEAGEIVRWQMDNARAKGRRHMVTLKAAVDTLRSNGIIKAENVDAQTGEVTLLSLSTIARAIATYGLSADVLHTPPPAMRMRVLHANHVWQVDASLCVLYYLPADGGLQVMSEVLFNDNKPKNIKKIENERVWRYVVVDVASGAIYVEYVVGGESGSNLSQIFINAMQPKKGEFWGVPKRVYCDAGSANTGAVFKGLCQQLDIDLQWHMPGNARATGAVEKAQHIVEINFESMLAAKPVFSLADLNAAAARWRGRFNATAVHTRHGQTRVAAWAQHVKGHLKQPPSVEVCRALAHTKPTQRRITQDLTVEFGGEHWDASGYPGVYRGLRVQVSKNPWAEDSIRIVDESAEGLKFTLCPLKVRNELGYFNDAPIMGESFKSHAKTAPELAKDALAQRSAADQQYQADSGIKTVKPMPFGGRVDPFKPLAEAYAPTMLPLKADSVHSAAASTSLPPISVAEACKRVRSAVGEASYPSDLYAQCAAQHAGGQVPQEWADTQITAITNAATAKAARPALRIVGAHK